MEVEGHLWKTCIILCELTAEPPDSPPRFPIARQDRKEVREYLGIKEKKRKRKRRSRAAVKEVLEASQNNT